MICQDQISNYIIIKKENTELDGANILLIVTLQNAKSETVKEFVKRLNKEIKNSRGHTYRRYVGLSYIETKGLADFEVKSLIGRVAKEMEGEG